MSHTYSAQFTHVVFSTKDRRGLIPIELQPRLIAYFGGIVRKLGADSLAIGGTTNHVHVLLSLPPSARLAEVVQTTQSEFFPLDGRARHRVRVAEGLWGVQRESVDAPHVKAYVENQEEHHRARSFEDEFLTLLRKSGLRFEERDVLG
jgi:REP element-mobilizing transposase RayT